MLRDLIKKSRSVRRFDQDWPIPLSTLAELIDLARLSPSGANIQPLKYVLCSDPAMNARIFPCLSWAGYLTDWPGPAEGERPSAYVVMLLDTRIKPNQGMYDPGIAAQTIMLAAAEKGLGGCIIGSVDRATLATELGLKADFHTVFVLALGHPAETVVLEEMAPGGDHRYWRDEKDVHHVPKRSLAEVVVGRYPPDQD